MKNHLLLALALAPTLLMSPLASPTWAAPKAVQKATAADEAAAAKIFQRAADTYGEATSVKMNYASAIKSGDDSVTTRGELIFEAPAHFRYSSETMGSKSVYVYDGYSLMMQENNDKPSRITVNPNQTVWDAMPPSLPDPFIDSFFAGENPVENFEILKGVPAQAIRGAQCDAVVLRTEYEESEIVMTVWFARETGLIHRVVALVGETSVTTDYLETELDADIAPETFTVGLAGAQTMT